MVVRGCGSFSKYQCRTVQDYELSNQRHSPVLYALFTRGWTSAMGEIAVVFVRGIKMNSKRAVKIFTILVSNHFKTQNGSHLVYGLQQSFLKRCCLLH